MKIGVVTNLDTNNYGSVLQAYALKTKLHELGTDSVVIKKNADINRSPATRIKRFLTPSKNHYSFSDKIQIKMARKAFTEKRRKLETFSSENLNVRSCSSLFEASHIAEECDLLLAGSDQIWSPLAGLLSSFTLLNFDDKLQIRKASYAASIGVTSLSESEKKQFENALKDFINVSVREPSSIKLLKELTQRPLRADVDPTLLFDGDFWKEQITHDKGYSKPYIFVYMLRPEPLTLKLVQTLAEQKGLKIKLCSNRLINKPGIENITDAGIEDFFRLIKHADYFITNSFHGTVFAVQFHKKFLSIAVEGSGARVQDFLSGIGLQGRIAVSVNDLEQIEEEISWRDVDDVLRNKRQVSIDYLQNLLNDIHPTHRVLQQDEMCTGCGACLNSCPKNCIFMRPDETGFIYPMADETLCINCGLCMMVCPSKQPPYRQLPKRAYAAAAKQKELLLRTSSGGMFSALADYVISMGGYVFGAALFADKDNLKACHCCVNNKEDLEKLQGSKYVQSEIGTTYREAENFLKQTKVVLFSGTPCQIAGLKKYLRRDYPTLYTVEVLCHGVPNNRIFSEFLKNKSKKILNYNFRSKNKGWFNKTSETFYLDKNGNKKIKVESGYLQSYYALFLDSLILRDSCYHCQYADMNRVADITIGDYWGIDSEHKELVKSGVFSIENGVSCVLINNERGMSIFSAIEQQCDIVESSFQKIQLRQGNLKRPAQEPNGRKKLLTAYAKNGYSAIEEAFKRRVKHKKVYLYAKFIAPNFMFTSKKYLRICARKVKKKL